ncbi:tape measure protein [Neoaquamicrobium sediminum]|uniref:tape measure protein n=1 Tax=Neoaquamicrobium sediminum TaxID=1849104 RepID=UPI001564E0AE|nr:tape measure protein [Mesorhizobium sediminum]NRC54127.1 tape measure protein [Mesorhizobium sediminum]
MKRFSDGGGGFTNPQTAEAIRRQREEVDKARASYEVLEARAQRLAAAQRRIGAPTRTAAAAQREAAEAARVAKEEMERQIAVLNRMPGAINRVRGLRGIFSGFYGESRQAMSVFQRMRGEILSLATAYAGLYGTIQNIGGVITAYQSLEAAQNRLGAVFNQNDTAVRNELSWLERQAARLGISFDTLSNQYSKFAVAARAANFESEATRKVFLSVAEAGRVNKLSLEQMSGIFLALEQMISKGKVQSEELRRQLGDRLPGAFNIMAKALGVTTAELDNMMKKGRYWRTSPPLSSLPTNWTTASADSLGPRSSRRPRLSGSSRTSFSRHSFALPVAASSSPLTLPSPI